MDYHLRLREEEANRWGALQDEIEEAQEKLYDCKRRERQGANRELFLKQDMKKLTEEIARLKKQPEDNSRLKKLTEQNSRLRSSHDKAHSDLKREKQLSKTLQKQVTKLTTANRRLKLANVQLKKKKRSENSGKGRRSAVRPVLDVPQVSKQTAKLNRQKRMGKLRSARQKKYSNASHS